MSRVSLEGQVAVVTGPRGASGNSSPASSPPAVPPSRSSVWSRTR